MIGTLARAGTALWLMIGYIGLAWSQEVQLGEQLTSLSISNDEALADYRAWIAVPENARLAVMNRGVEWNDATNDWYTQCLAPANSVKVGDWNVIAIHTGQLSKEQAQTRWGLIRDAYFQHVNGWLEEIRTTATLDLQAERDELESARRSLQQQWSQNSADFNRDFIRERLKRIEENLLDLELDLAGNRARLDIVREKLDLEEARIEEAQKEALVLRDVRRKALEQKVAIAEDSLKDIRTLSEQGRATSQVVSGAESRLLDAQSALMELDAEPQKPEPGPVHTRLREMLIEAETTNAETVARRDASDEQKAVLEGRLDAYTSFTNEENELHQKIDQIESKIREVGEAAIERISNAYRY